jgi:hypothetical protein
MDGTAMKITVYEFINDNRDQYRGLVKVGVVSWLLERDMSLYEDYQKEVKLTGSPTQAASNTGEKFKISERSVFRIVEKYSREVPQI